MFPTRTRWQELPLAGISGTLYTIEVAFSVLKLSDLRLKANFTWICVVNKKIIKYVFALTMWMYSFRIYNCFPCIKGLDGILVGEEIHFPIRDNTFHSGSSLQSPERAGKRDQIRLLQLLILRAPHTSAVRIPEELSLLMCPLHVGDIPVAFVVLPRVVALSSFHRHWPKWI